MNKQVDEVCKIELTESEISIINAMRRMALGIVKYALENKKPNKTWKQAICNAAIQSFDDEMLVDRFWNEIKLKAQHERDFATDAIELFKEAEGKEG